MTIRTALLLGVAGLSASTFGQSAQWLTTVDAPAGGTTAMVTYSLQMDSGGAPFVALSATIFDTIATIGNQFGGIGDGDWEVLNMLDDLTGDLTIPVDPDGDGDTDDLTNINAGQLTLFGPFTSDNPVDVFTFTWTVTPGFFIAPGGPHIQYDIFTDTTLLWIGEDKDSAEAIEVVAGEALASWTIDVPTPAGIALLGLGGCSLVRRRR